LQLAAPEPVLFVILLMIFFSLPEGRSWNDLRCDRPAGLPARLELRPGGLGRGLLRRGMIKNYRSILRANIRSLAVSLRGVVILPKHVQQRVIADLGRIKLNLHRLRMSGAVR